jgi:hypothetical protein
MITQHTSARLRCCIWPDFCMVHMLRQMLMRILFWRSSGSSRLLARAMRIKLLAVSRLQSGYGPTGMQQ